MPPLLLFDGPCALCHRLLRILQSLDRRGELQYASLQSETAEQLGRQFGFDPQNQQSLVLVLQGEPLFGHRAVKALPALLGLARLHPYRLMLGLYSLLPDAWQAGLYRFVARNRYKWFGRTEVCEIPGQQPH